MERLQSLVMRWTKNLAAVLMLLFVAACKEENQPVATAPQPQSRVEGTNVAPAVSAEESNLPPAPTKPQAKLPTLQLFVGTNEITAEIARTHQEQPVSIEVVTGMMWRTNMAEMDGMLFVFPRADFRSFWMRNTLLPLSCAYIDPNGIIVELHDMKPRDLTSIRSSSDQIQYVLEMNQGWFQRHNVTPGTAISTARGPLSKTFFGR
jgi:uncharacterized protein